MTQRRNWVSNATCESSLDPASKRKGSAAAAGETPGVSRIAGGHGEAFEGVGRSRESGGNAPPADRSARRTGRPEPTPSRVIRPSRSLLPPPAPTANLPGADAATSRPRTCPSPQAFVGHYYKTFDTPGGRGQLAALCRKPPCSPGRVRDAGPSEHRAGSGACCSVLHAPRVHHGLPAVGRPEESSFPSWTAPGKPTVSRQRTRAEREGRHKIGFSFLFRPVVSLADPSCPHSSLTPPCLFALILSLGLCRSLSLEESSTRSSFLKFSSSCPRRQAYAVLNDIFRG